MNYLKNTGEIHGLYDNKNLEVISNETETLLAENITIEKVASKEAWANDGSYLGFTITITNNSGTDITGATFEDAIDTGWATLVEDSVYVDGIQVPYEFNSGRLIVQLDTISDEPVIVTFELERVTVN